MFSVTRAKRRVLERLSERDWAPTDLADELGTSPEAVYNHLAELADLGLARTSQVPAKTRPKTAYSIGRGFIQFFVVAPGTVAERRITLNDHNEPLVRIWTLPQAELHPFLQEFWWVLTHQSDARLGEDIRAVGVYGSVARGAADPDSDIDVLLVAADETVAESLRERVGVLRLEATGDSRILLAEIYPVDEYEASLDHDSHFLEAALADLHPLYDPDRIFVEPDSTEIEVANEP